MDIRDSDNDFVADIQLPTPSAASSSNRFYSNSILSHSNKEEEDEKQPLPMLESIQNLDYVNPWNDASPPLSPFLENNSSRLQDLPWIPTDPNAFIQSTRVNRTNSNWSDGTASSGSNSPPIISNNNQRVQAPLSLGLFEKRSSRNHSPSIPYTNATGTNKNKNSGFKVKIRRVQSANNLRGLVHKDKLLPKRQASTRQFFDGEQKYEDTILFPLLDTDPLSPLPLQIEEHDFIIPEELKSTRATAELTPVHPLQDYAETLPINILAEINGRPSDTWQADQRCAVCLDESTSVDMKLLPCNHTFHAHCIVQWVEKNYSCPLCRQSIEIFVPSSTLVSAANKEQNGDNNARRLLDEFDNIWESHYYLRGTTNNNEGGFNDDDYMPDSLKKESLTVVADISDSITALPVEEQTIEHLNLLHNTIENTLRPTTDNPWMLRQSMPYVSHAMTLQHQLFQRIFPELANLSISSMVQEPFDRDRFREWANVSREHQRPRTEFRRNLLQYQLPTNREYIEENHLQHESNRHSSVMIEDHQNVGFIENDRSNITANTLLLPHAAHAQQEMSNLVPSTLAAGFFAGGTTLAVSRVIQNAAASLGLVSSQFTPIRSELVRAPQAALFFCGYESAKKLLGVNMDSLGPSFEGFIGCGIAAAAGATLSQVSSYLSPRIQPLSPLQFAVQFAVFEQTKSYLARRNGGQTSVMDTVSSMLLGGVVAASINHPIRMVQQQLRSVGYGSVLNGLRATLSGEASISLQGAVTGTLNNIARVAPACVCTAVAYEYALRHFDHKTIKDNDGDEL